MSRESFRATDVNGNSNLGGKFSSSHSRGISQNSLLVEADDPGKFFFNKSFLSLGGHERKIVMGDNLKTKIKLN